MLIAAMAISLVNVNAQTEGVKIPLAGKAKITARDHRTASRQVVSCGTDTLLYPYLKELVFNAPNDSFFVDAMVGNVRTAAQAYELNTDVNIVGVQFWGGAYSTSPAPQTLQVRAYLYAVDAFNMPVATLDSADMTVTESYDFYEAVFAAPHTYNQNFAVGVRSIPNDTLAVITNNAGNVWSPDYAEDLAWRRFGSGTWNSSVNFFGQDLEYMIFPIVSYNVNADFAVTNDTVCEGSNVAFINNSSPLLANRMFNLLSFDAYWGFAAADSSYSWDFDNSNNWISSVNGNYTYNSPGTYSARLVADMTGYYSSCSDTLSMDMTVKAVYNDTSSATICFGDTLMFGSLPMTMPGIYTQSFATPFGCDSIATIILYLNPVYSEIASATICNGHAYPFGSQLLTSAGVYMETFQAATGCDSTVTLTLGVTTVDASVTSNGSTITANEPAGTYQWINCADSTVIANETGQSFTATTGGDYAVIVTANNCTDTSACTNVQVTGITEGIHKTNLRVYPNPATGKVQIDTKGMIAKRIFITNMVGEIIRGFEPEKAITSINLENTESGMYFIHVINAEGTEIVKLIIR